MVVGGARGEINKRVRRAYHGAVASPLLNLCQMCHSIQVGGNELASGVLPEAHGGVLNLVVVNVAVKANDDRCDVWIRLKPASFGHWWHLQETEQFFMLNNVAL